MKKHLAKLIPLTVMVVFFSVVNLCSAQTIQFTAFGKLCYSNNIINLDNHVNLKNGKWELIDIDGKKSSTSEYTAATSRMVDSTKITGNYPGKYYWRYQNYNGGSPLVDSIYMTINALPNLTSIRDPAPKCFDDDKFDLLSKYPIGSNLDSTIISNSDIWFTMKNSGRDTMIEKGKVAPYCYYTNRFFTGMNTSTPGYDNIYIHVQDKITGCNDSALFKVTVNPNPVVGLRNITVCQDAGSFKVNPVLVSFPNNPDAGVYTWDMDSAPSGLSAQDKRDILQNRSANPFFKDFWFNPVDPALNIDHAINKARLGRYKLKFCYIDGATNCTTCEFSYVCIEQAPDIIFKPFDKFCYSDDTICLNNYVNLPNGNWKLKNFNLLASGPALYAARARMIDSTKINVIDTPGGQGGVYYWVYCNRTNGCPTKDSIEMVVNARPQLALRQLDTICESKDSINLLNLVTTPNRATFLNGYQGTGWYGKGIVNNQFITQDAVPPQYSLDYFGPIKLVAKYYHPNTTCGNEKSIEVVVETKQKLNTGVYRVDNFLYSNDPTTTYQWLDCQSNQPLTGETYRKFVPTKNGSYSVVLTRGNCNSDTSACTTFSNVSTNYLLTANIKIYPNPIHNAFQIENTSGVELSKAALYSSDGKLIKSYDHSDLNTSISFDSPLGMYWLQIETSEGSLVVKMMK